VFLKAGITLIVPASREQDYIHDIYMNDLVNGIIRPEARAGLLAIVDRLKIREKIDGLILGGTELPLIMREVEDQGIPFLDTTKLHVEQVVAQLLS
jgi:aspartate racemase